MLITLLKFILATAILIISGFFLVKSLSKIARLLKISEFLTAFILMAFATSIPELFVGISSALNGFPEISLGNVIGANILNLTLITGLIVLSAREIRFQKKEIEKNSYWMLASLLFLIVLFAIQKGLSRIDGAFLLFLGMLALNDILKEKKKISSRMKEKTTAKNFYWFVIFILSFVGLYLSSNVLVRTVEELSYELEISRLIIGLFLVSFSTTLPELVFGISASNLKHKSMAIGDQIGSVFINSTLVIGTVSLIHPITTNSKGFLVSSFFMFLSAFIFFVFIKTGRKIEKIEGMSLIFLYILFLMIELFLK